MDDLLHLDFETYSEENLPDVGQVRYLAHPSTEILCFAWALNDEEVQLWEPSQKIPKRFLELVHNPDVRIAAWNARFELGVLNRFRTFLGLESKLHPQKMLDVQAVACRYNYPAKLEVTAKIFKQPKQENGKELINLLCSPDASGNRLTPESSPQLFAQLYEYCPQDVIAERNILQSLPKKDLSLVETDVWIHTVKQNNRGVRIDVPLVETIQERLSEWKEMNIEKLKKITGGTITTGHQIQRMKNLASDYGIELPNMQADTIAPLINDKDVPKIIRQVLKIRQNLGKISTAKYRYMLTAVHNDKVYDNLIYAAARTDRFIHVGLQLGNLPARTGFKDVVKDFEKYNNMNECVEDCIWAFKNGIDEIRKRTPNVMALASVMIRPCLIPPKGYEWIIGDYKTIEYVVALFIAHDWEHLDQFNKGFDPYKTFAATLYGKSYEAVTDKERFHGKTAILGLIFIMGAGTYGHTAAGYGIKLSEEETQRTVNIFRDEYTQLKKTWYSTYGAAIEAVENPGKITGYRGLKFQNKNGYLNMKLPTGKCIRYRKPFTKEKMMPWGKYKNIIHFRGILPNTGGKGWGVLELPPGQMFENAVQGTAREVLVRGMLSAERKGYPALCSVHDEGMHVTKKGQGSIEEFDKAFCDVGDWAKKMPIKVESYRAMRYRK